MATNPDEVPQQQPRAQRVISAVTSHVTDSRNVSMAATILAAAAASMGPVPFAQIGVALIVFVAMERKR